MMAVDVLSSDTDPQLLSPATLAAPMNAAVALAAPKDLKIGWSSDVSLSDALSFQFGEQPQPGDTWSVLENGVPIAVNTRYYKGLSVDTWETAIDALPFDFTGKSSWELAKNPVVLPTAYGKRAITAGNQYEIQVFRGGQSATSTTQYGRFRGASADGVNETQTGTVALLDLDYSAAAPSGVATVRAMEGEQVAAVVLDAGKKVTLRLGEVGFRSLYTPDLALQAATLKVEMNRTGIVTAVVAQKPGTNEWTLTIDPAALSGKGGLVSLRITNTSPGGQTVAPRYLGVIVKDSGGQVPAKPEWLAVGAVNTNTSDAQNFFRGTEAGDPTGFKGFDTQYIYLNDGPLKSPQEPVTPTSPLVDNARAWRTSSGGFDGKKLIQSLRESAKFGAVPQIVYYNLMAPNESREIALANLQNRAFLVEYFKDLKFTVDTIRQFAGGTTVSLILEPDLLAYMMQSAFNNDADRTYRDPSTIAAMTEAAYDAGFLADPGVGNRLPNTLPGFVEAINRGVRELSTKTVSGVRQSVNLEYGWKFNLWAYVAPVGGSIVKVTDTGDWDAGRKVVEDAAKTTADWYVKAGILTGDAGKTMDFIALDKYGTDGGATGGEYPQNGEGYKDPSKATFFWNADHWNNYLLFAKTLHNKLNNLPVRLWQLPVGHVNGSEYLINGQKAVDLANVDKQWEDSAVSYFFGDAFSGLSEGRINPSESVKYFLKNQAKDPLVSKDADGTVIWGSHMAAAREAGIESIMFGPGLANSTQGGGYVGPALDGSFWASKAKQYLQNPVPIPRAFTGPGLGAKLTATPSAETRVVNGSIPSATVSVFRTGDTSRALVLPVKVVGGTARAGSDFRKIPLETMRVRFAAGQSSALLVIPTLPTKTAQPQETITLRIGGANKSQPAIRTTVVLGATSKLFTSTPTTMAGVLRLANQMRAVETFSDPKNPGRIINQLRKNMYPDPGAENEKDSEKSGTNGLAAYPLDERNTPGAFQVDLANPGVQDVSNPWMEKFGEWQGKAASLKTDGLETNTRIAWSKATLSEFFGIEVDAAGLITRMPAAAAAVFLRNDALAFANSDAWNPSANPLVGQHIDNFQREQLSLYLAGRTWSDTGKGVQDFRTAPQPVMDLAEKLQYQIAQSFMYGVYQKYQNHEAYKDVFAEAQKMFGATLKITASTAAFGVVKGDDFLCRMNGGFVVAGAYVRGEVEMFNVIKAFAEAAKTGKGTWVINAEDDSMNVTFTRVTPAGTPANDAIFTVDKTPLNLSASFPSIFHYGAVVSQVAKDIDWTDKAAWGVKDRNVKAGLGYARLGPGQTVTGTALITQPGRYMYTGLDDGETLTLSGAGPFYLYGVPGSGGVVITPSGYDKNSGGSVAAGQKIDISGYGMSTPQQVLDASFYGWWGSNGLQMAKVNDPAVPANTAMYLYFVPAAGGDPANALANQGGFYDESSPYFGSARLGVANVDVLGRATTAEAWAANFMLKSPPTGKGVIDASAATGNVFIVANDSVETVKLGSGPTAAIGLQANNGRKTYVLDAAPLVGSGHRPFLGLFERDTIDARRVSGKPTWSIDNREQSTFDNKAPAETPYSKFAAFSRYFATDSSGNRVAEFAGMLRTNDVTVDPAAVIEGALVTGNELGSGASAAPSISWSQIREMPFVDMSLYPGDDAKLIDSMRQAMKSGIKFFALSAVNMDKDFRPVFLANHWKNGVEVKEIPATSGDRWRAVIDFVNNELRPIGGEIVVSFGADAGCNGHDELLEPALRVLRAGIEQNWSEQQMVDKLGQFYADVANMYYHDANGRQLTAFLDMNIEGYACRVGGDGVQQEARDAASLRSKALRQTRWLLEDYTYYTNTLEVSATLSAPDGGTPNLPLTNVALLANHLGEPVQKINIMAMWLGGEGNMLPDIKDRLTKVHEYLPESWTLWDRLGVIVQPGRQNARFFSLDDQKELQDWAFEKGLGTVGFWRLNSISGVDTYDGLKCAEILSAFDGK